MTVLLKKPFYLFVILMLLSKTTSGILAFNWIYLTYFLGLFSSLGFFFEEDFLSSLTDSLKNAQDYVSNELLPLIAKGLKAVQKVEDFVDATIGEDCQFECPNKNLPVPKKGHKPTTNGNQNFI